MYFNCHSYFSLKYGLLSPQQLVQRASGLGLSHLALTDINNTSSMIEFVSQCRSKGINPVAGIEFRQDNRLLYIALARNRQGFANLNRLLNLYMVDGRPLPTVAPDLSDVYLIYDCENLPPQPLKDHEFAGVTPIQVTRLNKIVGSLPRTRLVAWLPVTLGDVNGWETHQLLRSIAGNTLRTKLELRQCCQPTEYFRDTTVLQQIYRPYPELLSRAQELLETCSFELPKITRYNRQHFLKTPGDDRQLLINLARKGLHERYSQQGSTHRNRLEQELLMIQKLQFEAYFLITWDIVRFARSRQYRHVGRGSGANSLVAYCLYITDVDPIALDLYFERFINPFRPVAPDFDLDFCWDERDDVLRYVQQFYGHDKVGLLASYQLFKGKSVVRELGKVYGLTRREIDLIVQQPLAREKHHPVAEVIFREGRNILGLPSHLSIHTGGIVVAEGPLSDLTASQMMPKGFPILQTDMHHAAQWGLHKFDLLSQRGTGHIKTAMDLIATRHRMRPDIHKMEMIGRDEKTIRMLQTPGACIGCFYIESPAMRGLLAKVPCRNYLDLVAVSSIIRPGVAKSGMMQEYIERFHNPARVKHLHPKLADLLKETLGIMIYQEDVMKVVHHLAGFDLNECDLLRRLMTGKKKSEDDLTHLRARFLGNCRKSGIQPRVASEVWRQVESFSGYSFCKAHSATYAAESMQSLYLKAHYPLEFMVAVINNEGGFYPKEVYVRELIRLGAEVEPPCINQSSWLTRLEGKKVFLGFNLIKGLHLQTGQEILNLRSRYQSITRLSQVISEIKPGQLDLLIEVGAFRSLGQTRSSLLFERVLMGKDGHYRQLGLFSEKVYQHRGDLPDNQMTQSLAELRLLGFTLANPFTLLHQQETTHILQREMLHYLGWQVRMVGYYIIEKPVTTEGGHHMCFVTWMDAELEFFDSVHFPGVLAAFPIRGSGFYVLEGKVLSEHGYPSLMVSSCEPLLLLKQLDQAGNILSDYHYLYLQNGSSEKHERKEGQKTG